MNAPESRLHAPPVMPHRTDADWLAAHWMPFTGNRQFKADPRLIVGAQGAYFTTHDGRQVFDGLSGLWCTGLGHGRKEIADAIRDARGIKVDRRKIHLDAPIHQVGTYMIEVEVPGGGTAAIKTIVAEEK